MIYTLDCEQPRIPPISPKKNKKYSSNVKWFRNNFYLTPPNKKNATGQIKVIQPPYGCCWKLNNLLCLCGSVF